MGKLKLSSLLVAALLCAGNHVYAQAQDKAPPKEPAPDKKDASDKPKVPVPVTEPKVDGKPLSYWVKQLKERDLKDRQLAAENIARLRAKATDVSGTALEMLKDSKDAYNRRLGAYLLQYIRPDPKQTAPALLEALKDEDDAVRRAASVALAVMGAKARSFIPALKTLLKDKDADVRQLAAYVLGQVAIEPPKDVVKALLEATKDPSELVQKAAATALKKVDPRAAANAEIK